MQDSQADETVFDKDVTADGTDGAILDYLVEAVGAVRGWAEDLENNNHAWDQAIRPRARGATDKGVGVAHRIADGRHAGVCAKRFAAGACEAAAQGEVDVLADLAMGSRAADHGDGLEAVELEALVLGFGPVEKLLAAHLRNAKRDVHDGVPVWSVFDGKAEAQLTEVFCFFFSKKKCFFLLPRPLLLQQPMRAQMMPELVIGEPKPARGLGLVEAAGL